MNAKIDTVQSFGELTLESFRLNGMLLATGDELSKDMGLTSARWQVLGSLVLAGEAITVAAIARRMGLTRQSIQRIADSLNDQGYTRYIANPDHKLWKLVELTPAGIEVYKVLEARRLEWSREIVADVDEDELAIALKVLRQLKQKLT